MDGSGDTTISRKHPYDHTGLKITDETICPPPDTHFLLQVRYHIYYRNDVKSRQYIYDLRGELPIVYIYYRNPKIDCHLCIVAGVAGPIWCC